MASCELSNQTYGVGNKISITRNQVSKRTHRRFSLNIIAKKFSSKILGNRLFHISNRTYRTILKYGSLENYLLQTKRGNLSDLGRQLRQKVYKLQTKAPN